MHSKFICGAAALLIALGTPAWAQSSGSADAAQSDSQTEAQTGAQAGSQSGSETQSGTESDSGAQADTGATAEGAEGAEGTAEDGTASDDKGYVMGDVVLGDPDAPLTVIEYASFTCPHCGNFAVHTFPKLKEEYIDTGKVKFILREVYFDQYGLWASMVARCGGEKGFYPLADAYLTTQSTWTRAPDIGSAIQQIGRRAGLSAARLEQCLSDRDYAKELLADYQRNMEVDGVKATPTFIVGGEKADGAMSFEEFSELLDSKL